MRTGNSFVSLVGGAIVAMGAAFCSLAAEAPTYNRDIRPILSENCFPCHGPDAASRKAKLRLDSFAESTAARDDSTPAIVAGKPDESELVRRIFDTGDDVMPPEASHKVLSKAQKELLQNWVAEGAAYQPHWAFITPKRPELPDVKNSSWVRNPIDQFILAGLEQARLRPAPVADRRTLARRVSLDLTGLPPAPDVVEAFRHDESLDAYERLVDHFLARSEWGEHRARYWLDVARYADTHGIHIDNYREIWIYRDWVINAFNTNMPFDQFTIEQLAGDLLPNPTLEQKIASGFNRCNITTSEGGAIDEEYLVLYSRDRTETTCKTWLGLTAGCAVCHDHKYDPLSQKEFYQLSAFFNNTTQKAMDGNVKDTPPVAVVPKPEERTRWDELQLEVSAAQKAVDDRSVAAKPEFQTWLTNAGPAELEERFPTIPPSVQLPLSEGQGNSLSMRIEDAGQTIGISTNASWQDGAIAAKAWTVTTNDYPELPDIGAFERTNKFSYAVWLKLNNDQGGAVFSRMKDRDDYRGWDLWIEGNKPAVHIIHRWEENAIKVIGKKALPKVEWAHVCVTYDGSSKADGVKIYVNGELQDVEKNKDALKDTIQTDAPFTIGQRFGGSRVNGAGLQDLRIFNQELSQAEVKTLAEIPRMQWLATKPEETRSKEEAEELFRLWLGNLDDPYQRLVAAQDDLQAEANGIRHRGTVAHVMNERNTPPEAYLLARGEYDKRQDKVSPATPKAFPPMSPELPRNRLGFAMWLMQPENPLTARVTVNRIWQELFGTGLVRTSGDFGIAGELPTHPELLDWLAVEFRESGWDVKRLYKLIVMSATYRQSAVTTRAKLLHDPGNCLLSRGPRFRMDAEMLRDQALAASGLLVPKIGGPSVKPYQPDGVWEAVAMPESDTRFYRQDHGENLYRRSLYTFWKRAAPPAAMDILNAPSRETCTVRRERTDTPLQALVTLNDPQFVEAARNLAEQALACVDQTESDRIDFMTERLMARPLKPNEKKIVVAGLESLLDHYRESPEAAVALINVGESKAAESIDKQTLAAYTMVANQLMNLDEVLNK